MKLLSWIIMVPVAFIVIVFAISNRAIIDVDLWPLLAPRAMPLSGIVLGAAGIGFFCGALITWISAARSRRRARQDARRAMVAERALSDLRQAVEHQAAEHHDAAPARSSKALPASDATA